MLYRAMPKAPKQPLSILGFGCMRLPALPDGKVDRPAAVNMVRHAIDNGVNYLDTAYGYHGGESESVVGDILQDSYKGKAFVATKLPYWSVNEPADMDRIFDEQLARLRTDQVDFYLLHSMNRDGWDKLRKMGALEWLERQQKRGRIGRIGFSFHADTAMFKEIVDGFDWHFCQITHNYMDPSAQAGAEGLRYAAEKGLGVIVMGPLRGGTLSAAKGEDLEALWKDSGDTPTGWALRWLWNNPDVTMALSGMSTFGQAAENLVAADKGVANAFTPVDAARIHAARDIYTKRKLVPCTGCGYCVPCPSGVNIPHGFGIRNEDLMFIGDHEGKKAWYLNSTKEKGRASACTDCGVCEPKCPQQIPIREHLKEVVAAYEGA